MRRRWKPTQRYVQLHGAIPEKSSNDDWTHPLDPGARVTKMKDGRTHVLIGAESRTANVAGSAERTGSGLRQSPPHSRRAGPPTVTATRREAGAVGSTLIGSRRGAPGAFAKPRRHSQAAGGALGCGECFQMPLVCFSDDCQELRRLPQPPNCLPSRPENSPF